MSFLKGRSAVDLSYWILEDIEQAHSQGQDLSGIALDLRRAFHNITRPLQHLLSVMGMPSAVLDPVSRSFEGVSRLSRQWGW